MAIHQSSNSSQDQEDLSVITHKTATGVYTGLPALVNRLLNKFVDPFKRPRTKKEIDNNINPPPGEIVDPANYTQSQKDIVDSLQSYINDINTTAQALALEYDKADESRKVVIQNDIVRYVIQGNNREDDLSAYSCDENGIDEDSAPCTSGFKCRFC